MPYRGVMLEVQEWHAGDTAGFLRVPGADADKFSRGVVGLHTGSVAYPGAAVLGVEAAWRTGCGYVRYTGGAPEAVLARRPETVVGPADRIRVDAWVIGSGTDAATRTDEETTRLLELLRGDVPVVTDAGALDLAIGATAPLVLTPHAGEFARLCEELEIDAPAPGDHAERAMRLRSVASDLGQVVLLKGARTLIADPSGGLIAVSVAPGWLATAGAGDVLAGILGALVAANPRADRHEVAAAAAWLHGHAAAIASNATGGAVGHPIVALDVAEAVPAAIGVLLA